VGVYETRGSELDLRDDAEDECDYCRTGISSVLRG
jgi:hypothetical protein